MVSANKLKGVIAERGFSQSEIAYKIGITPNTFYRKIKKGVFLSTEIDAMRNILNLPVESLQDIFFTSNVALKATKQ